MASSSLKAKDPYQTVWTCSTIRGAESDHLKMALAHIYFHVPIRVCANRFGLGKSTAQRAVQSYLDGREPGVNGKPRYFSKDEEKQIEQYVLAESEKGDSLRGSELLDIVRDLF